ncbi:HEAT repeat protein [Chania multitudinisentens RB-25]|uniref:HEAT repeat protein n=1 Tax=Chania multitudinisentens RB-25 TaxID=1441930 RepID=W0LAR1_9GAMM|nr:DUF4132 domain-containing protein [Chania multitudinisentens]AHG20913.1 HEAT repeat protein [Chania multitudinisentens RB-25]
MIRKLLDLVPIFGKSDVSMIEKLLQEVLLPLAECDQALPKKALRYVIDGSNTDVFLALSQVDAAKAATLLKTPGTLGWWYGGNINTGKFNTLMTQGINARHKLYAKVGESFSSEQLVRLAKVIAAACQDININRYTTELPTWVLYLLGDAFYTTFSENRKLHFEHRNGWNIKLLADIIAQETDKPAEFVLFALFDRKDINSYHTDNLGRLLKMPDIPAYLQEKKEFVRSTLIENLSASGLVQFIHYLNANTTMRDFFADVIITLATNPQKTVRRAAEPLLNTLPPASVKQHLTEILLKGAPKQRSQAADLFARQGENQDVLQAALKTETSKAVIKSLESALKRFEVVENANSIQETALPAFESLRDTLLPESAKDLLVSNYQEMLENARIRAEKEIEDNKTATHKYQWAQDYYKRLGKFDEQKCRSLIDKLNSSKADFNHEVREVLTYKNRLYNLPDFTLFHALRLLNYNSTLSSYHLNTIPDRLIANIELRQLEEVLGQCQFHEPARKVAGLFLGSYQDGLRFFSKPEQVWPFFIQHPDFIAEALQLMPDQSTQRYQTFELSRAINVLATYPSPPTQFVPRLMELALGENKTHRISAQKLLESLPNIHESAQEALTSSKQEIRITAIDWLMRLKHADSVAHLYTLLKKEKREVVRAALLTALEAFGEDISDYLSEKTLLAEAHAGLKAKPPASLAAWFDFNSLPVFHWQNKQPVDANIIHWWIVLAAKLKAPAGNALLQRYISLLSKESQQKLSELILYRFVAQDTKGPTLDEAMAEAQREAPGRLSAYKNWAKSYPEYYAQYASYTLEQVIENIKSEVLKRYLGSAINDKGLLALVCGIEGHVAVSVLRNYMRDHYPRRAQIEAMIEAVAVNNDPLIIQFLLSLSRRYRTASVQEKARLLVAHIAERNGWSADELADRTIPTAGMDDSGTLVLEYGARTFSAKLDAKQKLVLFNPEGKEIKALPAARKDDDEEQAKEAKKLFSTSKKELKQVIEQQSVRLYEAMCAQREWLSGDWQEYLFGHPVMRRLIEQLVWQELSGGEVINQFRPADDGCLLDLNDDEVTLSPNSTIRLAHAALLSEEDRQAWLAHFKDYKIKFLFAQMVNTLPALDLTQTEIEDRKGWLTDAFTLRGILTKLGYQRGPAEDGGSFSHYYKHFSSLNYYVNIGFSGSFVPEENIPAVLFDLSFEKNQQNYWNRNNSQLQQVPPILLAESYADYLKVADACAGFDPEWEKKTPW